MNIEKRGSGEKGKGDLIGNDKTQKDSTQKRSLVSKESQDADNRLEIFKKKIYLEASAEEKYKVVKEAFKDENWVIRRVSLIEFSKNLLNKALLFDAIQMALRDSNYAVRTEALSIAAYKLSGKERLEIFQKGFEDKDERISYYAEGFLMRYYPEELKELRKQKGRIKRSSIK